MCSSEYSTKKYSQIMMINEENGRQAEEVKVLCMVYPAKIHQFAVLK